MCTWVISSLWLRGSSTLICNTDKKDSRMRTPWISLIIDCSDCVFIDSTQASTAEECQNIMENTPPVWGTIVHHSTMADIKEVVNTVNTSQSHLHEAWFQSCKWGN